MRSGGLKKIHIVIIGVVLGLLMAGGMVFAVINPERTLLTEAQTATEEYETKAAQKPQAEKEVRAAEIARATKRIDLLKYENRYMRLGDQRAFLSMKDPQRAMILLWNEQAQTLGPLLTTFIRRSGVRLVSPLQIPGAPVDPNQINPNLYMVPLGQIQVIGTFAQINRFLRSLRAAPRLIQVNNVELAGESPQITATIDLTMLVLPRDSGAYKPVPLATGDASAAGGTFVPSTVPGAPPGGGFGPSGPTPDAGGANGGGANGGANGGS